MQSLGPSSGILYLRDQCLDLAIFVPSTASPCLLVSFLCVTTFRIRQLSLNPIEQVSLVRAERNAPHGRPMLLTPL